MSSQACIFVAFISISTYFKGRITVVTDLKSLDFNCYLVIYKDCMFGLIGLGICVNVWDSSLSFFVTSVRQGKTYMSTITYN